jgi:MFS superfamily sulfate permease-like transporter
MCVDEHACFLHLLLLLLLLRFTSLSFSFHKGMVVITIVSVSIIAGSTITAISVGAFCSVLLFVYQWHQVGCIKYVSSGLMWRSSIDRPELHVEWLEQHGDSIQILQLQGFIFFGNSQMVYVYVLSSILLFKMHYEQRISTCMFNHICADE